MFACNRNRKPSGPLFGDSAQYPTPPCRLTGSLPNMTSLERATLTGTDHCSASQL